MSKQEAWHRPGVIALSIAFWLIWPLAALADPTSDSNSTATAKDTLARIAALEANMTQQCSPADGSSCEANKKTLATELAALAKLYQAQAFLENQSPCFPVDQSSHPAETCRPQRFVTIRIPVYVRSVPDRATAVTTAALSARRVTAKVSPAGVDQAAVRPTQVLASDPAHPGDTYAIAYLDTTGTPISMASYDWRTCSQTNPAGSDSGGQGGGQSTDAGTALIQKVFKYIAPASDEYSLAFASSCNSSSTIAVPSDPIYQNSGIELSLSYNSFTTTGSGAATKVIGSGSGKIIGAIGFDLIPWAVDTFRLRITNANSAEDAQLNLCPNCHLFPFVGIDYSFNEKATAPGHVDVNTSFGTKQTYYGVAFNDSFSIDPLLWPKRGLSATCPVATDPSQAAATSDQGLAKIDKWSEPGEPPASPETYTPNINPNENVQSPAFDSVWPAPLSAAGCSDSGSAAAANTTKAFDNFYVWEGPNSRPRSYVNLTSDLFVLNDELNHSQIGVFNIRVAPFGFWFDLVHDLSFGLNEFNRPPVYIGGYRADALLRNPADGDGYCSAGGWCGFDDLNNFFRDTRYAIVADLRFDSGHFFNRGVQQSDPTLTEDYVRIGTRAGAVVELNVIKNNPIALQLTYLDYAPIEGFRKSLGLTQFEADYVLPNFKGLTLALSYENGRNQDTAERVEDWSLSVKYAPGK